MRKFAHWGDRSPASGLETAPMGAILGAPRLKNLLTILGCHGRPRPIGSRPSGVDTTKSGYLNAATLAACSAITRALSSCGVPAGSPLISTFGLDHTGRRGQPLQLAL